LVCKIIFFYDNVKIYKLAGFRGYLLKYIIFRAKKTVRCIFFNPLAKSLHRPAMPDLPAFPELIFQCKVYHIFSTKAILEIKWLYFRALNCRTYYGKA